MKKRILFICCFFCMVLGSINLFAQSGANDAYIILDISGSMNTNDKFTHVKDYLRQDVFSSYLHPGDSVTLILFGDTAKEAFSAEIQSEQDVETAFARINALKADNDYTDIGVAMEKLYEVMSSREHADRRQTILFITDGKHAPPRDSPYAGKDLGIDERFREIGRKISREGWFMYVVGIGADTDAKKIADAVENSIYRGTDDAMSGVNMQEYTDRIAEVEQAQGKAGGSSQGAGGQDSAAAGGLGGLVRKISLGLGIPESGAGILVYGLLALIIIAILVLLFLLFRPVTVQVNYIANDKTESTEAKLGPGGTMLLNSAQNHLTVFGKEDARIFEIHRGIISRNIKIIDDLPFGDSPPYKKDTPSKITRTMFKLANGGNLQIRFK